MRDEDDDIPPAPGFISASVGLVDDESTESVNDQPEGEAAQEPGPSRCVVEDFIIFESCR